MLSLSLGLPGREVERTLLAGRGGEPALHVIGAVGRVEDWIALRREVDAVFAAQPVNEYALDLIDTVRARAGRDQPLSTRAALALLRVAKAYAVVCGRDYLTPDDVQVVAVAALAHRVVDATNGDLYTARNWVHDFVRSVPVPPAATV
jgi:MoxR-like ATPase